MNAQHAWPGLRIGDVHYVIGDQRTTPREWKRISTASWFKALPKRDGLPGYPNIALLENYEQCLREKSCEPDWVREVPEGIKLSLRHQWLMGDSFDPLAILPYRKDLNFSFAVAADGLTHEVSNALNLFRLSYIAQLGFLNDPAANELLGVDAVVSSFTHTRYLHSLTVMATAALIGRGAKIGERELLHLCVAALTHDALTPAGGDSTKAVDPEGLDEDVHYAEIFKNNPEWDTVREKYGLDEELLTSIVEGKGMLGRLLDLADKTSYVAHDMDMYLGVFDPRKIVVGDVSWSDSLKRIWRYRERCAPACQLWDKVQIVGGEVVVTNAKKLGDFLMLRALMFKHLYYNTQARYREHMFGVLLLDPLYRDGTITRDDLIRMTDGDLMGMLARSAHWDVPWALCYGTHSPHVESFRTIEEAKARGRELMGVDPTPLLMVETIPQSSKKAVRLLVSDYKGKVTTFAEAYPEKAREILDVNQDELPVKLYILPPEKFDRKIPETVYEKIMQCQRARFA